MKLAIMQPYFFPYLGYFQLIKAVDRFTFYDDVNYIKKGFINRNNILLNDESHTFTVPLKKASQNKLILETYLSEDHAWREKLMNMFYLAYKKAPFFEDVYPLLEDIIMSELESISELAIRSVKVVCDYLEIRTFFEISSLLLDDKNLKGNQRIISICQLLEADEYINPIGGIDIYDNDLFEKANIDLKFIKTNPINYTQKNNNRFISGLSIIDHLMFNNKVELQKQLGEYSLRSKS